MLIDLMVDGSHSYERTHVDALTATTNWVLVYLISLFLEI